MWFAEINFVENVYWLQIIWDEVGESDVERDKLLFQLEQECLEVYRRKVDQANKSRAQLRQAIADSEAELAAICSAMGERPVHNGQVCFLSILSNHYVYNSQEWLFNVYAC